MNKICPYFPQQFIYSENTTDKPCMVNFQELTTGLQPIDFKKGPYGINKLLVSSPSVE